MPLSAIQQEHGQRTRQGQRQGEQPTGERSRQGADQQQSARPKAAERAAPASYLSRWMQALGLRKLSTWLLALVLLAAVPVFAIQVYAELEQRDQRRAEVAEQVQRTAELVAARLERLIDNARVVLATLGRFPDIGARERTTCADVLSRLAGEFPDLAILAASTPAGEVFCTSNPQPPPTGVALTDRDYFQAALRAEREAERLFARQMVMTTAAFLVAALAAFWLGRFAIRQPVLNVCGAIDRVARGDLSARAGANSGAIEELAALGRGFDAMARQLHERDERLRVLMRELNHRIKNVFQLVQSIAIRTLPQNPARDAFLNRLEALARISTLFAEGEEKVVDFRTVAEAVLAPHRTDNSRLHLSGPELAVPARAARTLSLVLHELATNAAKYGALSTDAGCVELTWRPEPAAGGPLVIEWAERGGPRARAPERRGFGRWLIDRSVVYELGGATRLVFAPEGVRCRIELPLG